MKFIKPFSGVKSGEVYPTDFAPGDDCPAELVEAARATGAISEAKAEPGAAKRKG